MSALSANIPHGRARLWHSVWKLLRLRWVIFVSNFRRGKLRDKIAMAFIALLMLGALAFALFISASLLRLLRSPELAQFIGDVKPFLASIPTLVFLSAFAGIFLTSIGLMLQALYLAGDMDFLLSAPIPIRAIFITKLFQAILPNFALILLFALPVLYGLGISAGYNLLYYPLVLLMLALVTLASAGLSSLLVMLIVHIIPARRLAEVIGFIVALFSITCSQSGQLMNAFDVSRPQIELTVGLTTRLNHPWLPTSWVGNGLVAIGEGRWLSGFGLLCLTILLSLGVFLLSLATAERLYYTGWANVQVSVRKKKPARADSIAEHPRRALAWRASRLLPPWLTALIVKDFLMLRRDLRNLSQLTTPLILGVMYAILFLRQGAQAPAGRGEAPEAFMTIVNNLWVYGNVIISLFVGWTMLSRLALMGFSQEGRNYWLLKSAPLSPARLLTAKFLVAFLPSLALCSLFLLATALLRRTGLSVTLFSLAVVTLALAGDAGVNLAFGVLGANFAWDDPRRISMGTLGCLGTLASGLFMGAALALFFAPALLLPIFGLPDGAGQVVGLALGGAFSLLGAFLPLRLVRERVHRLAED